MNSATQEQATAAPLPDSRHVLQTIAHELRQPLSAIESTAFYLGLVLPRGDDRALGHVMRLRRMVEQSNWIVSCGLQLADDTPIKPERVDLEEFITESVAAATMPDTPTPALDLAGDLPPVRLDPGRGRTMVANVLTLFDQISEGSQRIHVRTSLDHSGVAAAGIALDIEVGVQGRSSEAALGAGASLCIASLRRMVEAHGGKLTVNIDPREGIRLRIVLAEA